ncbi:MAG: hypothetical protein SV186_01030 [Candidatus Nanohaloarchaea archaeon]|nr:hypothetical protein [Candidatus Nanohaloarchaea archaeon]
MKIVHSEESDPIEALETLADKEDEGELRHPQQIGLEYLRKNAKIKDRESYEELKDELAEIDSLKEKHIIKILDILPKHEEEVEALFSKERVKLDDEEIQQIIDICSSYEE